MKMLRLSMPLLFAAVLFGQPVKDAADPAPPPEVDQALRARITEFLHYHVTGEFRKAEALVADDTKDLFYNRSKTRYTACKGIASIKYSENFTHAYATVLCSMPVVIQSFDNEKANEDPTVIAPPAIPIPSTWKLDNGKWCWYLSKDMDGKMPFGMLPNLSVGSDAAPGGILPPVNLPAGMAPPMPPGGMGLRQGSTLDPTMVAAMQAAAHVPVTAATFGTVAEEALHHVKLEPAEITMKSGESAKVKISNDAEDERILLLIGAVTGIDAKLDATNIEGKKSTTLNLKAKEGAQSGTLNVVVASTGEMLPLQIRIQ
jgi:hypothetical protein